MTNEKRLSLIEQIVKSSKKDKTLKTPKKRGRPPKAKTESNFVPMEPTAPSHHDINEEFEYLTNNKAESFINYEN
jgi:hypothetical protein